MFQLNTMTTQGCWYAPLPKWLVRHHELLLLRELGAKPCVHFMILFTVPVAGAAAATPIVVVIVTSIGGAALLLLGIASTLVGGIVIYKRKSSRAQLIGSEGGDAKVPL